jgi:hypothetical protein
MRNTPHANAKDSAARRESARRKTIARTRVMMEDEV